MIKNTIIDRARKKCRKKFLYYFPGGFEGKKFNEWERSYKEEAHNRFLNSLNRTKYHQLLTENNHTEIASTPVKTESRTNLLFSFEKMALRDAVKDIEGAEVFSKGLFKYLYGKSSLRNRFETYVNSIEALPRKQTRVLTWPLVTVFGFLANPLEHIFLKPKVTQKAAEKYKFEFNYKSRPNWETYESLLEFAELIKNDLKDLKPIDNIDLQSFIWVMGSDEYPD